MIFRNKPFALGVFLAFLLVSTSSFANNCVDQLTDINLINQSKQQGLFKEPKKAHNITFSYNSQQAYSDYLKYAYLHISQKNPRANIPCPIMTKTYQALVAQGSRPEAAKIVDLVAPFELTQANNDKAVLLVHGLTDSPFTYHDLAQIYWQQGYTVRTLLLPGHATAPAALQDVDETDWQKAVHYALERTLADFEQVLLGGYSTGAALLIDQLTQAPVNKKISGLMLFSPASEPHNKNGWLAKWVDYIPFIDWIDEDADIDFAKYESFPFAAASSSHEVMSAIKLDNLQSRQLPNIPVFATFSDIDTTIDNQATFQLLKALHNPQLRPKNRLDRIFYFGDKSNIPSNFPTDYTLVSAKCDNPLCKNIKGMSHIGIVNNPNNPHYGQLGKYRNCGSYLDDDNLYQACKTTADITMGERTKENLARYQPFARLTYNPYFHQLSEQMTQFISEIEQHE